jgi:O-antigen ligase
MHLHLCALFGAISMFCLMCVNMIGFVVEIEDIKSLAKLMWQPSNIASLLGIFTSLFFIVHVQFGFEDRSNKIVKGKKN